MRTALTICLLALALAVTGCAPAAGGDDDGGVASLQGAGASEAADPSEEGSEAVDREEAQLAHAECMREHGVDFPDPGEGPVQIDGSSEEMREADEACAHLREDIEPPELSNEQREEFKDAALEHARCMREHGIDFPDPTFGEDGGAQIRIRPGSGVDPDDPEFREAQEACADKLGGMLQERRP
jgi:hypothetical protein